MRMTRFGLSAALEIGIGISLGLTAAHAQTAAQTTSGSASANTSVTRNKLGFDLGVGFATVHANASPGACGCFFMTGGTAHASLLESHGLATVADFGITHKNNINNTTYSLTLSTYTIGERYQRDIGYRTFPFVQALAGLAHSSTPYQLDNSKSGFAALVGGGVDVRLSPRWDLRLVEADYLANRIPNGQNNWQNQFRIGAGVNYRIR